MVTENIIILSRMYSKQEPIMKGYSSSHDETGVKIRSLLCHLFGRGHGEGVCKS